MLDALLLVVWDQKGSALHQVAWHFWLVVVDMEMLLLKAQISSADRATSVMIYQGWFTQRHSSTMPRNRSTTPPFQIIFHPCPIIERKTVAELRNINDVIRGLD